MEEYNVTVRSEELNWYRGMYDVMYGVLYKPLLL